MPPSVAILPPAFKVANLKDREQLDYFYLKLSDNNPERHSQWWIKYRRAQLWKNDNALLACEKFSELAKDPLFPLNSLAWVRAQETCTKENAKIQALGEVDFSQIDSWVKPTATDVLLARAERDKDKEQILAYSYEKSKSSINPEQKIELTTRALEMAKALNNEAQITLLTKRLYKLAPRLNPAPKVEEYLEVAKDFRRVREFGPARMYYSKILQNKKTNFPTKLAALHGIRFSWKNERNKEQYVKATEDYARFVHSFYKKNKKSKMLREKLHDSYVELMRTYWTESQLPQARECLDFLEKELKGKYSLGEVYWLRGRMSEEKQEFADAVKWFTKGAFEKPISRDLTEKILWYQAWNLRKTKQYTEARDAFQSLISKTDNEFAKARYQYWLARTFEDLDQKDSADAEYKALITSDPLGYYGLLAHRQTHEKIPAGKSSLLKQNVPDPESDTVTAKVEASKVDEIKKVVQVPVIEWLISVEEFDLAKTYLDAASKKYNKHKDQNEETWLALFNYYARSGHYLGLYEQLGQLTADRRNKILDEHPELLFPRPYYEDVRAASERFSVHRELIYGIMRQESAFNPRARSHADAFGLMQMLPEVARLKAQDLDVAFAKAEDLYDPYTNIQLGSAFIKDLWDRNSGQFILAVASYNASEGAIQGWLQTRYNGDSLEFIEDIPYEETRGYVRLVMRNFIFYQVMESDGKRVEFPEELLRLNPVRAEVDTQLDKAAPELLEANGS